jgi:hypothetical protein
MSTQTSRHLALHLLHGWWIASCPDCGFELAKSRDQEAAERAGGRRRCPVCGPSTQVDGDGDGDPGLLQPSAVPSTAAQPASH